jgi:hypothetical protein
MTMIGLPSSSRIAYAVASERPAAVFAVREAGPPPSPKRRLLDRVRDAVRARHYSRRTEKAYVHWIKRYIFFHDKRHPAEMGAAEVTQFLSALAVQGNVAASTQNQALSALLFLYRHVLEVERPWLDSVVRAKQSELYGSAPARMRPPQGQGRGLRRQPDRREGRQGRP